MLILGLTGSIGMGKSTTANMFRDEGIPVHDADATVHRLYSGELVPEIEAAFPNTTTENGVDREKLSQSVLGKPDAMKRLEAIVHPAVQNEEVNFLNTSRASGAKLVLLDIPLLFETGAENRVDKILVVTAAPEIQRTRVLSREGMSDEKFNHILSRQVPDAEKRERADFIIDTGLGLASAKNEVRRIIAELIS